MTLRDLAYCLAVAQHGHFSRAAKACEVSQPTLSGQIRKLEDELGIQIFERDGRRIRVTPAGEAPYLPQSPRRPALAAIARVLREALPERVQGSHGQ